MSLPTVLAHGVCRLDKISSDVLNIDNSTDDTLDNVHYFKGIRTILIKNGVVVHHSKVSWASDVNTRAEDLRKNISNILGKENCENVNNFSMDGIFANDRYSITSCANAANLLYVKM